MCDYLKRPGLDEQVTRVDVSWNKSRVGIAFIVVQQCGISAGTVYCGQGAQHLSSAPSSHKSHSFPPP